MGIIKWIKGFRKKVCGICKQSFKTNSMMGCGFVDGLDYSSCKDCTQEMGNRLLSAKSQKESDKIFKEYEKRIRQNLT